MTSVLHLAVYMSNEMETPDISKLDEACNATTKLCDTFVDLVQDVDKKDVNELVEMSKQLKSSPRLACWPTTSWMPGACRPDRVRRLIRKHSAVCGLSARCTELFTVSLRYTLRPPLDRTPAPPAGRGDAAACPQRFRVLSPAGRGGSWPSG